MTSKDKTKTLVNKATTDDRNPPSGYLLKELAARTMQISECQTIEDLIMKKLAKSKPYVKYKALRVVKFLCESGSPNWRRAWQRNTDKLRDAQQFRGPPDPIYGDAPYQQVRKAAKDAMTAVFAQSAVDNTPIRNRIKGLGGDNAYSSNDTGSSFNPPTTFGNKSMGTFGGSSLSRKNKAPSAPSFGKQMPGHGNTNYTPSVPKDGFRPMASKSYINPANLSGSPTHSSGKLDTRGSEKKRKKRQVGGAWGDDNDDEVSEPERDYTEYEPEPSFQSSSQSYSVPSSRKKLGGIGGNIKKGSTSSGQYEKRWVDNIVKSGGVGCKIVDLPKKVKEFDTLSKNHVLEYLDEKLEDSAWQKKGKALALIEALLKGKSSDDVIEYFNQSPENVQSLLNSKKTILRKKAAAVMEYLELDEEEDDVVSDDDDDDPVVESVERPRESKESNLLNLTNGNEDEDDGEDNDGPDMFAGMNGGDDDEEPDLLKFTESKPSASPPKGGGGDMDIMSLMSGMNLNPNPNQNLNQNSNSNTNAMNPSQPTQNDTTAAAKQPYDDPFGDLGSSGTQPPPNTSTNKSSTTNTGNDLSAFFGGNASGGSNMNGNAAASTGTTSSAFGFDLNSSSQVSSQPTTNNHNNAVTTNSGTSAFGFDLTSGGGGNAMATQQTQNTMTTQQASQPTNTSSMNSSAFGIDIGGGGGGGGGSNNNMNANQSMMTSSMLQQSNQTQMNMMNQMNNLQQMQNMMGQMNPQMMQQNMMNPNMMNPQMLNQNMMQQQMRQNMMQQGNMMNMNMMNSGMMQQQTQPQPNLFQQAMAGVGGHGQPQQQSQQSFRNNNDPFSGLGTSGSQAAQTTQAPTQPPQPKGPDPFAQFGLNSMK